MKVSYKSAGWPHALFVFILELSEDTETKLSVYTTFQVHNSTACTIDKLFVDRFLLVACSPEQTS